MSGEVSIRGGAGPQEAAAITAVVAKILADEAIARATPPTPPRQSTWVLAWRPREVHAPLPSHTYDATTWELPSDGGEVAD